MFISVEILKKQIKLTIPRIISFKDTKNSYLVYYLILVKPSLFSK